MSMEDKNSRVPGIDLKNGDASSLLSNCGESLEIVLACICELDHSAAVVELEGGEEALLPWKGVWPGFKIHDKYKDFRVIEEIIDGVTVVQAVKESGAGIEISGREIAIGDHLRVVPSADRDFGNKRRKIVSHILVNGDQWNSVADWQANDIKVFTIESITDSWAWGRIFPGVRARAFLGKLVEILPKEHWPGHQLPVCGDEIAGWFLPEETNQEKRIVTLDYVGYVKSQVTLNELFKVSNSHSIVRIDESDDTVNLLTDLIACTKISTLLLVDDDKELCSSLSQYLREECNITTLSCFHEHSAINAIENNGTDIDLAIIDVKLHPGSIEGIDCSGIRVAQFLEKAIPYCPVVLITGEEIDPHQQTVSDNSNLCINDIVNKPLGQDGLFQALSAPRKEKRPMSEFLRCPTSEDADCVPPTESEVNVALQDLKNSLNAEAVVLFAINPISDEVTIEALVGPSNKYNTRGKQKLGWSPIRDAAVKGEKIFTSDARNRDKHKHQYLQRAYNYQTCVGVPVNIDRASYNAYALFAFHLDANGFVKETALPLVLRTAREVGQILRIGKLEESIREMKPFEMMGQSYGSMAHDLSRDMSSGFLLDKAIRQISSGVYNDAEETLHAAMARLSRAQRVVRSFQAMARGQREDIKIFHAREEIEMIVSRLDTELRVYNAALTLSIDRLIAERCLKMRRNHLDQLLTNLTLNAAQQCQRLSLENGFSRTCEIQIEALEGKSDRGYPLLILCVHDNGPGIHHKDFNRVFDLHYTTKEHGCGMGLDICQKIVQDVKEGSLQGKIKVMRSLFLCGTCFEVRLPMSLEEMPSS